MTNEPVMIAKGDQHIASWLLPSLLVAPNHLCPVVAPHGLEEEVTPCRASIGAHRRPMRTPGPYRPPGSPGNICAGTTHIETTIGPWRWESDQVRGRSRRSPGDGGCDFPRDPDTPPDRQPLFWSPQITPQAVTLSLADRRHSGPVPVFRLAHLDDIVLRRATDGWHGVWRVEGINHQFWLPDTEPDAARSYAVILSMDAFLELRTHAARRLWRSFNGRPPGPEFRSLPAQLRQWHALSLRALDARLCGESYRSIAEALLGFRGAKEDFESDPRKNKARRLVANGIKMAQGGYRRLLHYPIRPEKR